MQFNKFFILKGEVLHFRKYCLNGITRGKAIKICQKNDIPINIQGFTFEDIENCEEAFVTGTFAGIIPVSKIEGKPLQSTLQNSLTNKIRHLYNQSISNYID